MSEDNTKTTSTRKASRKNNKVLSALKNVLEQARIENVPYSTLVKSHLNVRTVPYTAAESREMADSIASVGLLQNLVVHSLPDGRNGVLGGGLRLSALDLLTDDGQILPDTLIPVKRVPEELAVAASIIENEKRKAMHPAEQIIGFRAEAEKGKTEAEIGALFGYSSRHVQRCLKLANLAPVLLQLLAKDEINLEMCQALAIENNQERQVQIWERAKQIYSSPSATQLKNMLTTSEVNILDNSLFEFVGREIYEAAGGVVREDLFSSQSGEGYADKILLEKLALEKLAEKTLIIQEQEGWAWSLSRWNEIANYGEDLHTYYFCKEPDLVYTSEEEHVLETLNQMLENIESDEEAIELQEKIDVIEDTAIARGWTSTQKASSGVVVSYNGGYIRIQRGVCIIDLTRAAKIEAAQRDTTAKELPKTIEFSATLVKAMSCERTLAVQAAVSQQTHIGVAMLTWTYCLSIFDHSARTGENPLKAYITNNRYSLVDFALTGKDGKAYTFLQRKQQEMAKKLPTGWENSFTWLLEWSESDVSALLGFCVAFGVCGIQERLYHVTDSSPLEDLETALNFDLRDWWQPTAAGYFCKLSKDQIFDTLNKIGMNDVADEASKLRKGEAAELAENAVRETRWVPEWMKTKVTAKKTTDNN
jgi:ParB family chromosome partitioning protein